jgi:hypothetical protein
MFRGDAERRPQVDSRDQQSCRFLSEADFLRIHAPWVISLVTILAKIVVVQGPFPTLDNRECS